MNIRSLTDGKCVFTTVLLGIVAILFYQTLYLSRTSRLAPLVVLIPTAILLLMQAARDVLPRFAEISAAETIPASSQYRQEIRILGWLLILLISLYCTGFYLTLPAFTLLYLSLQSGIGWKRALITAIGLSVLLLTLVAYILQVQLPPGYLWE